MSGPWDVPAIGTGPGASGVRAGTQFALSFCMANHEIHKLLTVSFAHLTPAERLRFDHLTEGLQRSLLHVSTTTGDPPSPAPTAWGAVPSAGLSGIVALARELGCDYVLFDPEADDAPGIPIYEDDGGTLARSRTELDSTAR